MKVSYAWLKELVPVRVSPAELAEKLTMAGFEVEGIEDRRQWAEGVVLGKIISAQRHPNADKLQVCMVDVGQGEPLQIVCGAPNARAGLLVPVALVGTYLPNIAVQIKTANLRGVRSTGMICSLAELGLAKESAGIHEFNFPDGACPALGTDVRPLLGLEDAILDVTSTANRADALSMVGIAREVCAILGGELQLPTAPTLAIPSGTWVQVADPKACPYYRGTVITGVRVTESPDWLKSRLEKAGLRSINNIVDITNYILLEWGQPLHAFDLDKLQQLAGGLAIQVNFAETGETLTTLDGVDRQLQTTNLLIRANGVPVALAGVMGGANTEVSMDTQNILLECALFSSVAVRRSARAQGLRTEASARYERGVNPASLEIASDRAIQLILQLAGGAVAQQSTVDHRPPLDRQITLTLKKVWLVLGLVEREDNKVGFLQPEEIEKVLGSLGFGLHRGEGDFQDLEQVQWTVTVPPYRYGDIEREIDLIEEIARIYGYSQFVETLPARTEFGYLPDEQQCLRQIRNTLQGLGLTEVLHSSLGSPLENRSQVLLTNPIATEYSALRPDLLTGLLHACAFNLNQGNGVLNGFEWGRVFGIDDMGMWETDHLALIMGGNPSRYDWQKCTQPMNWYEAKGILEIFFDALRVSVEYQPDQREQCFHPGRTASLWINGERLGTFGEIHPTLRRTLELPDQIYGAEMELDVLLSAMTERSLPVFKPFSPFPPSDRDLAVFVPLKYSVSEIQRAIYRAGGDLLQAVELFDEYRGEGVPADQRSLAFRLIYRSRDKTLTDSDIQPIHQQVRETLVEKFQATLRS